MQKFIMKARPGVLEVIFPTRITSLQNFELELSPRLSDTCHSPVVAPPDDLLPSPGCQVMRAVDSLCPFQYLL